MKVKKQDKKKTIKKKIELRDDIKFLNSRNNESKQQNMNDRTRQRVYGTPRKKKKSSSVDLVNKKQKSYIPYKIKDYGTYQKKENVDYDVVIYIPTYNRYDMLIDLLDQLYEQPTEYTFKIIVLNDGSNDIKYKKVSNNYPEIDYLENSENGNIKYYWKTTNKLLEQVKKYSTHAVIQIDDDFKLCNNFIDILIDKFFELKKINNAYMGIRYHIGMLNNKNYDPDTFFDDQKRFQGVDGGTLFDPKFFELINYRIPKVYKDNTGGSGVWGFFNNKIREFGIMIYTMRNSLANHTGEYSKMHPSMNGDKRNLNSINFIDNIQGTTYNIKANNKSVNNNNILLAGPWVGEFGWELFCWQGYIRHISKNYNKVVIVSREGHDFLYNDFYDEFHTFNPPHNTTVDSWMCKGINPELINNYIKNIKHTTRINATNIGFLINGNGDIQLSDNFKNQEFIKYESNSLNEYFDILIHPRNRNVGNDRNWNKENWELLVNKLSEYYSIAIIGSHESFNLSGAEDYRNIPIKDTVSLMNRSKLIIGPSSGPMHLASLSGLPHLVWSTSHNKNRYLKAWNPFNTPVHFYDKEGWNPKVDNIFYKIKEILK